MKIITLTDKEYLILRDIIEVHDKIRVTPSAEISAYQGMLKQVRTPVYDDQKDWCDLDRLYAWWNGLDCNDTYCYQFYLVDYYMVALSEYGYLKTLSLKDRLRPKADIQWFNCGV